MPEEIRAFICSTYEDLKEHRAQAIATLRKNPSVVVTAMEEWSADPAEPKAFSRDKVAECNCLILLVAYRRGYIPEGETKSITQLEYEYALQLGLPIFVYLLEEDALWRERFNDLKSDPEIIRWREELGKKYGLQTFTHEPSSLDVAPVVGKMLQRLSRLVDPVSARLADSPADVVAAARRASDDYIDKMQREGVYLPDLYARRVDLEDRLRSFLDARCQRTGMLIVGSSGVGKTTTLCHIVADWRQAGELLGSDIVLLLGAGTLPGGAFNLREVLLDQLQAPADFSALQARLQAIQAMSGARLVLVIDGIDKHPQPREFLRQLDQLIVQYDGVPWLKVIASVGEVVYNTIRTAQSSPITARAYYTFTTREGSVETEHAEFPLGRLTDSELKDAYDRYRQRVDFAPLSVFEELTDDVKSAIANPLFLRIVMEVFSGKRIPRRVLTAKVLQQYCEKKVFGDALRRDFIRNFVRHLYEHRETSAKTDDLRQVDALREHILDEHNSSSPYLQLLEEKVLEKQAKKLSSLMPLQIWVGFTYDRLLEYLLTFYVLDESVTSASAGPNLHDIVVRLATDANGYPPLQGVLVTILLDKVEEASFTEAAQLLQAGDAEVMRRVAVDLLTELELMDPSTGALAEDCGQNSQAVCLIEAMMAVPPPWLKAALLDFGARCQRLGRLSSAKLAYECGVRFCRGNAEAEGVAEMLDALGCAQFGLGDLKDARGTLEEAIARFRDLPARTPSEGHAKEEALCLINLSEVYHRQGDIPRASELLGESRQALERIRDREGLAIALQKQAVLMRRDGCSRDARECHREALAINDELGDERGRATNLCGIGLTYLVDGEWEAAFGELKEALSEYEKIGDKRGIAYTCNALGETYRWQGDDLDQAMEVYSRALRLYEEMAAERDVHMVESNLGATHLFAGNAAEALRHLRRAQALQIKEGHEPGEPETLAFISGAALSMGDPAAALEASDAAAALLMEDKRRFGEEDVQLVFWYRYQILKSLGRVPEATAALDIAYQNVMTQVEALCDLTAREAFVQNFRLRREIVEAAQA